jgi:uncharacterized protein YdaU (DUF1376 family)
MNYYEKHLGDYAKDTTDLSMAEHGAYNLLLDRYYATEKPIPREKVYKVARAQTPEERQVVDSVLADFFTLEADGCYHQKRCDETIAAFAQGEPGRQIKKSNEAERQQRYRDERNRLFLELHAAGHYPHWNIAMPELRALHATHCDTSRNAPKARDVTLGNGPETREATATNPQPPISNHQPINIEREGRGENVSHETSGEINGKVEGARQPTPLAAMSIALRLKGVKVTSIHPLLVAWVQDNYTPEQLLGALAIARDSAGEDAEIGAKYLDKVLRNPSNWPRINRTKPNGSNGSPAPMRASRPGSHATVMAALDAATDQDSEDYA